MTRKITERALDDGLTSSQFPWVAEYVLQKIPELRFTVIAGSAAFVSSMKNCILNKRSYENKQAALASKDPNAVIDFDDVQRRMKTECAKKNPSTNVIKACFRDVRKTRISHAKRSTVSDHLKEYPALHNSSMMFWEFSPIVKVPEDTLRTRLISAIPKLAAHLKLDAEPNATLDKVCALLILRLCEKLKTTGRARKKADEVHQNYIFRLHEVGTLSANSIPEAGHQPCTVMIGDPNVESLSAVVYADCCPLFSGTVTQAVPALVAAYFVFQTSWPTQNKLPMTLLSAIVVPEKMKTEITKTKTLLEVLEATRMSVVLTMSRTFE